MLTEQVAAWQGLFDKFANQIHQAIFEPQPGQVWVLSEKQSRWGDDGYFYSPPNVLLLEKLDGKAEFCAAQIYSDRRLMSDGDIWLGDRFGFAQSWNTYVISKDLLNCWLGVVTDSLVAKVLQAGATNPPSEEFSILALFRKMEKTVGSYAALTQGLGLPEFVEETVIDLIPGLKLAIGGARDFVLDIATETLELLCGTFKPVFVLRGSTPKPPSAKLSAENTKLLQEYCSVIPVDVKVAGNTLTVTLKWLRGKPTERPIINAILNGVDVSASSINIINAENIIISHDSLSHITKSHISAFRVKYVDESLTLDLSTVQ